MLLLRCTYRVLDLFGQKPREVQISGAREGLGEWYVNVADEFDGIFFVCVNAKSLYTLVLDADAGFRSVDDLTSAMVTRLLEHLHALGVGEAVLSKVAKDYGQVVIGKTASRSLLGTMNDLVNQLYFHTGQQMQNAGKIDLRAIEEELNVIPQRPIGWAFAKDRLVELCSRM